MEISEDVIYAYSLKNAIEHKGPVAINSVINSLFSHGLQKDKIKDIMPKVQKIITKVNKLSIDEQEKEFEKFTQLIGKRPEREGLPELEDAEEGITTRFSPSPSGPMHIGHIATAMISSLYVKKYGGKFYFRMEDTNPENIYPPAYKMLKEETNWLFGNVKEYMIQSERIPLYYKYIEKLIKGNSVYVCTCNQEKFKLLVDKKKACPCRIASEKNKTETKEKWEKMLNKKGYKEGEAVLRFKSDLNNPNPAFRDFPLARINLSSHPLTKNKYRVWPLMNLSVVVDDIETKITHVIRGKDHRDNAERQRMLYHALGQDKIFPHLYFVGRYNFTDMKISTTETRKDIEKGKYSGWDDIRLPFLEALKRRGYQKEAFEKMVTERGLSEVDKKLTKKDFFDVLNQYNREVVKDKSKKVNFKVVKKEKANSVIIKPDLKETYIDLEDNYKPKKDEIIYLPGLGYVKYQNIEKKDKKNINIFWFLHE